jgi:hypothetical protein
MWRIDYTRHEDKMSAYHSVKTNITPEVIARFNVKADMYYDDNLPMITATGKGFTVTMKFDDSLVDLDLDLSFLLKPARGKIEEMLTKQLKRVL